MPDQSKPRHDRQSKWPRAYLLEIYNKAVDNGHLILNPITQEDAASLTASLYRLRRKADTTNRDFILPEYQLVTVGHWRPDNDGTLPIMYSTAEFPLPNIIPVSGETILSLTHARNEPHPIEPPAEEALSETEIDDYVAQMLSQRRKPQEPSDGND